jgi:hypothetical protein
VQRKGFEAGALKAPVTIGRDAERALIRDRNVVGKEALGGKALAHLDISAKERRKGQLLRFGPEKFMVFGKASGAALSLAKGEG